MAKPSRKVIELLSVGKYKHSNIPTYVPHSDGGLQGSFIDKTRTQYNTTEGLMATTIE